MRKNLALAEAYKASPVVEKVQSRRILVLDKDGTIASGVTPTATELESRKKIRQKGANCAEIASTFRTIELGMSAAVYRRSLDYGFNRPPPRWLLPDGTRTSELDKVDDFAHLLDFDAFNSAGIGVAVRKNGGYVMDTDYDLALGGANWRPRVLDALSRAYPDGSLDRHFARIEDEENYRQGRSDVWPLPYRIQLDFTGEGAYQKKEAFGLRFAAEELRRHLGAVLVDESNPAQGRYTTYIMPKYGTKERSLDRLLGQITYHAQVPLSECEVVMAGDTLTDLHCGLYGAQGAKDVTFIVAGGSRLASALRDNQPAFAGVQMVWSRTRTGLTQRSTATSVTGVYYWRAHRKMRPRKIILADYAPWSSGLVGAESLLACLDELGW